jgi:hypothetical protein
MMRNLFQSIELTHFNHGPLQIMIVLITPSMAEAIARGGYSKEAVNKYRFEHSIIN